MRKIMVICLMIAIALTGCTKPGENKSSFDNESEYQNVVVGQESNVLENVAERAEIIENVTEKAENTGFEIKGDVVSVARGNDIVCTKEGETVIAYRILDNYVEEQPLETIDCRIGNTSTKLYYYTENNALHVISEHESKCDTTYALNESTVLLVRAWGERHDIYKIDIKTGNTEKLQLDFGTDDFVILGIEVSPGHSRGIVTLRSDQLDCIYYLVDFMSGELWSLNDLLGVSVYKTEDGEEVINSRNRFIDDDTILSAIIADDTCELVKYNLKESSLTSMGKIENCGFPWVESGKKHTFVLYNNKLVAVNNSSFKVTEYDIGIHSGTSMYKKTDMEYLALTSNYFRRTDVIDMETGEVVSDGLDNNALYVIGQDGTLFEYDIVDNHIILLN